MKKLPELLVDILKTDPLWYDLVDTIHEYTEEHVVKYIRVLDKIRVVTRDMDPDVVDESIRQLGLDINSSLMERNGSNIRKAFYQLSKFYTINGTDQYPNFIKFLLGRHFSVQSLYTADYVNFFTEPLGPMVHEGGQWFPTSHKNIMIDSRDIDQIVSLVINTSDINVIRQNYDYRSKTEEEKAIFDAWLSDFIGRYLIVGQDDPELIDIVINLRISEIFYKFAPIQDVIKDIYTGLQMSAGLYMSIHLLENTTDRYTPGSKVFSSAVINIRPVVSAGREYPSATVTITYTDDSVSTLPVTKISDSKNFIISTDPLMFADPSLVLSETTEIECEVSGQVFTKTVNVLQSGVSEYPSIISISGPTTLISESRINLRLNGRFSGQVVSEVEDNDNVVWSVDSDKLYFDGNDLVATRITDDFNAVVTATYNNELTAIHFVSVKNNLLTPVPVEIMPSFLRRIDNNGVITEVPANNFVQGQTYRIATEIRYSDQTYGLRNCSIQSKTAGVEIVDGIFTSPLVYADFNLGIDIAYSENDEEVFKFVSLLLEYPALPITAIEVMGPDDVLESSNAQFYVVATYANNQKSLLSDVYWRSPDRIENNELIRSVVVDTNGVVSTPVAAQDYLANISASIAKPTDGQTLTASRMFTVKRSIRTITALSIISNNSLPEFNEMTIRTLASWSTNESTEVLPAKIRILKDDIVISQATLGGTALIYENFDSLILKNHDYLVFTDGETGLEQPVPTLVYPETNDKHSGLYTVEIEFSDTITNIVQTKTITLMPVLAKAISLQIFAPAFVKENSRYFFSTDATFDDGTIGTVASGWEVTNLSNEPTSFASTVIGYYDTESIVSSLIGYTLDDLIAMDAAAENLTEDERNRILNGDPMFSWPENRPLLGETWVHKLIEVIQRYGDTLFPRLVMDTSFVLEDTVLNIFATYNDIRERVRITILLGPDLPDTAIESWYLWGPVEIFGNSSLTYSYALYVKFEGCSEYAVSNDWSVDFYKTDTFNQQREILTYLTVVEGKVELLPIDSMGNRIPVYELTDEQVNEILPIESVLDIDQNGYLYPRMNVSGSFVVTALYDDGRQQFTEDLLIRMDRVNTNLEGLDMYLTDPSGSAKTIAFGDLITDEPSMWSESLPDGTLVYQLGVDLRRVGSLVPETPPGVVLWKANSISSGVAFDESSGRLFVSPQTDDQEAVFSATYEEEFRETEFSTEVTREKVVSSYNVIIRAHKAIDIIELAGDSYSQDNRIFYPDFDVFRRTGTVVNEDIVTLNIINAPAGVTVVNNNGILIPLLNADATISVRTVATEGTRQIFRDFNFDLLASFIPVSLDLSFNPTGIRDNSSFGMTAMLFVRNSSIPMEVTAKCYWRLDTLLPGLTIDNKTGRLTVPSLTEDLDIHVRATYNDPNLTDKEKTVVVKAFTSYPRFWTAGANAINNAYFQQVLDQELDTLHTSNIGGSFVATLNSSQYLYYAYPKILGDAAFTLLPRQFSYAEWDNMMNAIEVVRTYPDGLTEVWKIHRSVDRGLGTLEFGVLYNK